MGATARGGQVIAVRPYRASDYSAVASLYKHQEAFGGVFSEHRDSEERLSARVAIDADAILVAESGGRIVGTVSLIEDGRVAWLYRFAVQDLPNSPDVAQSLSDRALAILRSRGHEQVLVYAPLDDSRLEGRYTGLGFSTGSSYVCYYRRTQP